MTDLANLSAADLAAQVISRQLSALEATSATLDRIRVSDGTINSCTEIFDKQALANAERVDAKLARGDTVGPLAGVPFVVKSLFDVEGVTTLAGAKLRQGLPPARRDAPVVAKLRAAGAILVAATNMDEFAYGFTTENEAFGTTRNPRDLDYLAGGSSGGSAAAVAAGHAHIGLGSDTNGSIRIPASFCGVFGLKPTFGRLSRTGAFPFVASLDHVGPFARSTADLALAYDIMQGEDLDDLACANRPVEPVSGMLAKSHDRLRVGVLGGWFSRGATDQALEAVDIAARCLGASARVELPESDLARAAAFAITASEGGALHLPDLRRQAQAFDPAIRDRLLAGALLPAALVSQAQRFRRRYQQAAKVLLADYDVLIAPATPCCALKVGQKTLKIEGVDMLARAHVGIYTQPLSFIGLPIVVAPITRPQGLPVGVQLVAAPWREDMAFRAAAILEQEGAASAATTSWS